MMSRLSSMMKKFTGGAEVVVSEAELSLVREFFMNYRDFRTVETCARVTGLSVASCARARSILYERRELGLYFFEAGVPPHSYMRRLILAEFPTLDRESRILEIGPGDHPIFPPWEYTNWHGVDKYLDGDTIRFREQLWGRGKYPENALSYGTWETLAERFAQPELIGSFDIVAASHSYEHVFQPVTALRQARRMLREHGVIFLFVPDGLSDDVNTKDPSHTLYLVPEMISELFDCAGGFRDLKVEVFRPNADLAVSAIAC